MILACLKGMRAVATRRQVRSLRWSVVESKNFDHAGCLDHAEYDGTDKGEGDICGDHAQPIDESHGNAPLVYVTARYNARVRLDVPAIEKDSVAAPPADCAATGTGKRG
jgi:hypothetical protein